MFAFMVIYAYYISMRPEEMIQQKPQEYSTLYLDMDAFFASVEQYYNPYLRDKPIGIATGSSAHATIVAASYIAKQHGIGTGTKVAQAKELCPDIHIVFDSAWRYKEVHMQFMDILHNTIGNVQARGIDEAYIKIPSYAQTIEQSYALAEAIKDDLYSMYNEYIGCSIGVASNIWLAKMAASRNKPNGLVMLNSTKDLPYFYQGLRLTSLTGVGHRLAKRLHQIDIHTPLQFYQAPWQYLYKHMGVNGQKWYLRMRGIEVDLPVIKDPQSVSHQVTTAHIKPKTEKEITTLLYKIAQKLAKRLNKYQLYMSSIAILLIYEDKTYWSNKIEHTIATSNVTIIYGLIKMLLKKHKYFKSITKIVVTFYHLTSTQQLGLLPYAFTHDFMNNTTEQMNESKVFFERQIELNKVGFAAEIIRDSSNQLNYI